MSPSNTGTQSPSSLQAFDNPVVVTWVEHPVTDTTTASSLKTRLMGRGVPSAGVIVARLILQGFSPRSTDC
jgi:hypothetical protein